MAESEVNYVCTNKKEGGSGGGAEGLYTMIWA